MNRGRPETGSIVALVGGVLLLISLFLDWYKLPGFTVTAWTAFEVWDLVLAALALAVIVAAATDLGWWRGPTHAAGPTVLGLAAVVIVASQLLDPPPSVLHSSVGDGGWIALVGGLLMAVGPLVAESRVTLSFNSGARGPGPTMRRRAAREPVDPPLAAPGRVPVDRRPAGSGYVEPPLAAPGRVPVDRRPGGAGYVDPDVGPPPPPPPRR
jgi:hypothetical protein